LNLGLYNSIMTSLKKLRDSFSIGIKFSAQAFGNYRPNKSRRRAEARYEGYS